MKWTQVPFHTRELTNYLKTSLSTVPLRTRQTTFYSKKIPLHPQQTLSENCAYKVKVPLAVMKSSHCGDEEYVLRSEDVEDTTVCSHLGARATIWIPPIWQSKEWFLPSPTSSQESIDSKMDSAPRFLPSSLSTFSILWALAFITRITITLLAGIPTEYTSSESQMCAAEDSRDQLVELESQTLWILHVAFSNFCISSFDAKWYDIAARHTAPILWDQILLNLVMKWNLGAG